jgi:Tol biopolymer transport system component
MKTDGSAVIDVTNVPGADVYNYMWSLDGNQIYYQLEEAGKSNIYVANRDGTSPRNLTNSLGNGFAPQWIGN